MVQSGGFHGRFWCLCTRDPPCVRLVCICVVYVSDVCIEGVCGVCWMYSGFVNMVYVHMCVGVCACVPRGWRQMLSVFLTLCSFRQTLLISGSGNW